MDDTLKLIKLKIFDECDFVMSDFMLEQESKEYDASQFTLCGRSVICRTARITPKKSGQFVTFWKRSKDGPIEPYDENDPFDLYIVNVVADEHLGQFVFPKQVLIKKGIISTQKKEGKRAFRVYPIWDIAKSKQAEKTQQWQLNYFYEINISTDLKRVRDLYELN